MSALPTDAQFELFLEYKREERLARRRYSAALRRFDLRVLLWCLLGCPEYCELCGTVFDDALGFEPDHVDGRVYELCKIDSEARLRRYCEEILDGVRVRALCRSCNGAGNGRGLFGPWRSVG